jgi:hypothetical protein
MSKILMTTTNAAVHETPRLSSLPDCFKVIHRGVISKVALESGTNCDRDFLRLKVIVILETKDTQGTPCIAEKTYNFHPDGHGRNAIVEDYLAWSGKELTKDEQMVFDPRKFAPGQLVGVEVYVCGGKGDYKLQIKAFHPPASATKAINLK